MRRIYNPRTYMTEPTIRRALAGDLDQLKPLWLALYRHQREHGMLINLPEDSYERWKKSMLPSLGRFANVIVAHRSDEIVGFVVGRIRALPPYFGSTLVGTISELFVCDSCRGSGVGRKMLVLATEWFTSQNIARIELQVVVGNPEALRFYRGLGWQEELIQLVWNPNGEDSSR